MNFSNWKPIKNKIPYRSFRCPHCGSHDVGFFFEVGCRQDIKSRKPIKIEKQERRKTNRMVMRVKKPNVMCILGDNSLCECMSCNKILSNVNFMLHNKKRSDFASKIRTNLIFHRFV